MSQWKRIKAIVGGALEREGAGRRAYLEQACVDDATRDEVESLLAAYDESTPFFETWQPSKSGGGLAGVARHIGPYRLTERLGQGGMGTVYRAERDDDQFQRQVALKVLHHGREGADFAQRFVSERQILASLSHPHIAHLYDGGLAQDRRPFFAMELVDGQPITQYCKDKALSIKERLRLFLYVAKAVRYAHRNLVVHRDLKPSNILVTNDGTPRLLDFGIAKLLDEEAPYTQPLTQTGQFLMTPEYAAPEQVTGEAVTTSTDVYQLGVLLYELLTGCRPYHFDRKTPSVIEQVILEEEPSKPSVATARTAAGDEEQLAPLYRADDTLCGDLDTIALKALRKEPKRRYSSVEALIEDVERYLESRPIAARPATWRYQARKFAKRNRWGVGTAAGFLVLLLVYAATVTVQARRIASERDRAQAATASAQQSAEKSQQMSQFLVSLFEDADPRRSGGQLTARNLLDKATAQLDDSFSGDSVVEADLLEVIGNAYRNQGLYQKTYELHRHALALRQENESPDDVLATAENNVGEALYYLGQYDDAQSYYRTSLEKRRRVLDANDVDIAQSLNNLALIDVADAHYEQARHRYKEALAIFKDQLGEVHWRTINALNNLAQVDECTGHLASAERYYRKALKLRRRLHDAPDRDAAIILNNLGAVVRRLGRFSEAEEMHRQALALFQKVTAKDAPFIGFALLGIARVKGKQKQYEEAEHVFEKALAHYRSTLPDGHERIAEVWLAWGRMNLDRNQPEKAVPLLRKALQIRRAAFPAGHWKTARVRCALASALTTLHRYVNAETVLKGGYEALRQRRGVPDRHVRAVQKQFADLYDAWGKPERAAVYRDSLRAIDKQQTGPSGRNADAERAAFKHTGAKATWP